MSHDQLIASVLAAARPEPAQAAVVAAAAPAAPEAPAPAAAAPVAATSPVVAAASGISAEQRAEIVTAERTRIRSILSCEQAQGREKFAAHLAFGTNMAADEATGFLEMAPAAPAAAAAAPEAAAAAPLSPLDRHMAKAGIPVAQTGGTVAPPNPKAVVDLGGIYAERAAAYGQ